MPLCLSVVGDMDGEDMSALMEAMMMMGMGGMGIGVGSGTGQIGRAHV